MWASATRRRAIRVRPRRRRLSHDQGFPETPFSVPIWVTRSHDRSNDTRRGRRSESLSRSLRPRVASAPWAADRRPRRASEAANTRSYFTTTKTCGSGLLFLQQITWYVLATKYNLVYFPAIEIGTWLRQWAWPLFALHLQFSTTVHLGLQCFQ